MRKHLRGMISICNMILILVIPIFALDSTNAADLTSRSIKINDSSPSVPTTHRFDFTLNSTDSIGSIKFQYCANSPLKSDTCIAPAGFSAASAVLADQTGETGFSIDSASDANTILITRPSVSATASPVSYTFNNVVNHSTPNSAVYVRIASYASEDGTGTDIDYGAVALSTASALAVAGYVPPHLTFCVGVQVDIKCANTSGSFLDFGEFNVSQARFLTSQFSVSTNDPTGYVTYVSGSTMTSGNNIIPAMENAAPSQPGSSQFGMNLRANTNPSVGTDPAGVGTGAIVAGYNLPNQFYFKSQAVAASPISSDFNRFTSSYIVNISSNQNPGIYSTTLTYIASAAF